MMKDTVQYFADLELSHVNGVKHPASPHSVLCVAAEKDVLAFSEAGHLQSCSAFCTLLMLYKRIPHKAPSSTPMGRDPVIWMVIREVQHLIKK